MEEIEDLIDDLLWRSDSDKEDFEITKDNILSAFEKMDKKLKATKYELRKWEDWPKKYDMLTDMRIQSEQPSLAAKQAYINALEFELKHVNVALDEANKDAERLAKWRGKAVSPPDGYYCRECGKEWKSGEQEAHAEDCCIALHLNRIKTNSK